VAAQAKRESVPVAIVGGGRDAQQWASVLEERGVEVLYVDDLASLLANHRGSTLVFAEPRDAASLAARIAAHPSQLPVTLMIGTQGEEHPHTSLFKAIVDAKRDWEGTFDAIVDPVAILDGNGMVTRGNLGLARALGRPIREILSLHYAEVLGLPAGKDPIALSLQDGQARTSEAAFEALPGTQQVTTSLLRDARGTMKGLVVIVKDVNEFKQNQERLRQAARLADIGQLAAGVAHEINTPLASIALRAESLMRSAQDPKLLAVESFKNFPRYLKTIDEEIFRCKKIIGALLEFSRTRTPEVQETSLNPLVQEAADLVRHQMALKQVTLALRLDPKLPPVNADGGQIRQVLIALLMNAFDATPAMGQVEVETKLEAEGKVRLTVADTGVGISKENLEKIFSPFFTTKPVGQGTGLGLAICHGIVASHGGEIKVESEVGRGSRFHVILPSARP
jgi:two-component system NtrC family sensor kinase